MKEEKKNQIILITTIVILLISVFIISIVLFVENKKITSHETQIKLKQIYSSEHDIHILNNSYYYGTYDDKLSVIIDSTGIETINLTEDIPFKGIYLLKSGNYLIYDYEEGLLKTYIFNGQTIDEYYNEQEIKNIKPIFYEDKNNKYIIGFEITKENEKELLNIETKTKINIDNILIKGDKEKNNEIYIYNDNKISAQKEELTGIIDIDGNQIIDYKYEDIYNSKNNTYIIKNKKDLYTIMSLEEQILLKNTYKDIISYDNYYLLINTKDKMALYNTEIDNITKFELNYNDKNNTNLYEISDNIIIINNTTQDETKEYSDMYIITGNEIKQKTIEKFNNENLIYSYTKDKNISIYDPITMEETKQFKIFDLSDITILRNTYDYGYQIIYKDKDNNEQILYYDSTLTKIESKKPYILKETNKYVIYKNQEKIILTNKQGEEKVSLDCKKATIHNDNIIIDKNIYQIIVENA